MAPRSTGCRNCVRRRVKCDERRPFCDRCEKAKLQCDGFRNTLIFIDETRQTLRRLAPLQSTHVTTAPTLRQSPPKRSGPALEFHFGTQLALSSVSDDVYLSYLLDKFFASGAECQDYSSNRTWMVVCLSRQEEHPTAALALKCLATSFFGRKHRQNSIMNEGAKSYGQALLALRQTLQDPNRAWSFDALAATTALSHYEYIMFTTRQGWIQHAQGVAKLIEMRGPERFQQWPERAILDVNKLILIAQCLTARKRCFLEGDEWQNVHRAHHPEKLYLTSLNDIFAKLPGIVETIQGFESSSVDPAQVKDDLEATMFKLSNLIQDLQDWYYKFTHDFGHIPLETPAELGNGITSDAEGPLFGTLLEFTHLEVANAFTNHHAIKIAALEWKQKLVDLTWQRGADHEGMLEIPAASELALDICRVEYHLRPANAQAGAFYMLMPARMAYFALPKWSREAQWLARILGKVAETSGFELARNMLDNIPIRKRKLVGGKEVLKNSPATSGSATE
jgi:hypothetical protein